MSEQDSLGRIAIVSHSHPSLSKGGAEIAAYSLFQGLRLLGLDAVLIAACPMNLREQFSPRTAFEFPVYHAPDLYSHFYQISDHTVYSQLEEILINERIKIVNFHHYLNFGINSLRTVKKKLGLKCFFTLHEYLAICANHGQMVTRPLKVLCSKATSEACFNCFPDKGVAVVDERRTRMHSVLSDFDGFISPSYFLSKRYVEWGLNKDLITVIENGVLSEKIITGKVYGDSKESSSCIVGYFGQINPFKGVDVILDAIDLLASNDENILNLKIFIHGNLIGQSDEFINRFSMSISKNSFVKYLGPYNATDVGGLMSACDYVVVPSRWWENSPVVIQEAYSVGVPVICTGIGGMAEKVPPGISGLHFRLGDAEDLVRVIRYGMDRDIRTSLCNGIPQVTSTIDMAKEYLNFFSSILVNN